MVSIAGAARMAEAATLLTPEPAGIDLDAVRAYLTRLARTAYVYMHIEPTNACNLACAVCPRDEMHRALQLMSWPVFEAAMERVLPSPVPMLAFVGFGEPTLHKRLPDMIGYARARRPDMIIKVTTNGSRLDDSLIEALFDRGLDLLEISVMGTSPAAYEQAMGLGFDALVELIGRLNAQRRDYALATFPMGDATPEEARRFWTGLGARAVEVKGLHRRGGHARLGQVNPRQAIGGYRARMLAATDTLASDACHKLYLFLHVDAKGTIVPCVQDINSRHALGDVGAAGDFAELHRLTRSHRPDFAICRGCELQQQDLLEYYARFFHARFADRVPALVARLDRAVAGLG
jgi:MoaA/NifB/PqqE/SkfB family radical SAM enzyme